MKQIKENYEILFDEKIKEEKLFIVPERYKEQKNRIKQLRDCRNETLADHVNVGWRMYAGYINGKHPIPADRLQKMSDYLGVNPDWLVGKSEKRVSKEYTNDSFSMRFAKNSGFDGIDFVHEFVVSSKLSSYMDTAGIQSGVNHGSIDDSKYMEVHGEMLSYPEYEYFMREMRSFIDEYSFRLVQTIKKSRNNFE